jgi:hypothetical protein
MADTRSTSTKSAERRYTYREYLKRYPRSAHRRAKKPDDREPGEVGKEMARDIMRRLFHS